MIDIMDPDRDRLGHAAVAAARDHAVADLELGHAFADLRDQPRDFAARRERAFGTELIFILADQHVGKVDRAGLYVAPDLPLARGRARQLPETPRFVAPGGGPHGHPHHLLLFFFL